MMKTLEALQRELTKQIPEIQTGELSFTISREGVSPAPSHPDIKNLFLQVRSLFEAALPAPVQYHLIFSAEEPTLYFTVMDPDGVEDFCMGDAAPDEPLDEYLNNQDWDALLR